MATREDKIRILTTILAATVEESPMTKAELQSMMATMGEQRKSLEDLMSAVDEIADRCQQKIEVLDG